MLTPKTRSCLDDVRRAHGGHELVREEAFVLVERDELVEHEGVEVCGGA